jgi:hypothetical protein
MTNDSQPSLPPAPLPPSEEKLTFYYLMKLFNKTTPSPSDPSPISIQNLDQKFYSIIADKLLGSCLAIQPKTQKFAQLKAFFAQKIFTPDRPQISHILTTIFNQKFPQNSQKLEKFLTWLKALKIENSNINSEEFFKVYSRICQILYGEN